MKGKKNNMKSLKMLDGIGKFRNAFQKENYKLMKQKAISEHRKKCLLIYITYPFEKRAVKHTNELEVKKLYSILAEKYLVDVIDYRDQNHLKRMDWANYQFVVTIDDKNLSKVFSYKNADTMVIYYATGANFLWCNPAEIASVESLKRRLKDRNIDASQLRPDRINNENYKESIDALIKCDAIWYIGNEWTRSTWSVFSGIPKYQIQVTGFSGHKFTGSKSIGDNAKSYLWFGGKGMIHKGLDLCIEAFARHPELNLYVAGSKDQYWEIYEKFLTLPNVKYLGFLDVRSKKYQNICNACAFSILPSCSEGTATSILTLMNMGLIPIVSKECGVDVREHGYIVNRDVDSIDDMLTYTSNMDINELIKLSDRSREYVAKQHSMAAYEKSVRLALEGMQL